MGYKEIPYIPHVPQFSWEELELILLHLQHGELFSRTLTDKQEGMVEPLVDKILKLLEAPTP